MAECINRVTRLRWKDTERWSCLDCKAVFLGENMAEEDEGQRQGSLSHFIGGVYAVELGSGLESSARMTKSTPGTACTSASGLCSLGECRNKISWEFAIEETLGLLETLPGALFI